MPEQPLLLRPTGRVPDGTKADEDGRTRSSGAGGVWDIEPDRTLLGIFKFDDEHAANLNHA